VVEELDIKLPTSARSLGKLESSRKTSISALLTMLSYKGSPQKRKQNKNNKNNKSLIFPKKYPCGIRISWWNK